MPNGALNLCTTSFEGSEYGLFQALRERAENVLNDRTEHLYGHGPARHLLQEIAAGRKNYTDLLLNESTAIGRTQTKHILTELVALHTRLWKKKKVLRVKFMGGDEAARKVIISAAREWERHANIKFAFVEDGETEIRIDFKRKGSQSAVGTDALTFKQDEATMNFDLFDETTNPNNFYATALHEFGHCLGCIHEHQSPAAGIRWNKDVVYSRMFQAYGWLPEKVNHNFFLQADQAEVSNSTYDRQSIMHYSFPPEFTVDFLQLPHNTSLSEQDIQFIGQCYPFPDSQGRSLLKS